MKSCLKCAVLVLAICLTDYSSALSGGTVSVKGRVLTEHGEPVSNASVYLELLDGPATGRPTTLKTNKDGTYELITSTPGTYAIHAFQTDEGYPDIIFAFNLALNQNVPRVVLNFGHNLTGVDIKDLLQRRARTFPVVR